MTGFLRTATHPGPAIATQIAVGSLAALGGLGFVAAGAWLPWVTIFNGLQPIPGFQLDGGYLAGFAVAAAVVIAVTNRCGGARWLRPLAVLAAAFVAADAADVVGRITAYVAQPGPAGALTRPTVGPGAPLMAAGGGLLVLAALITPARPGRLAAGLAPRLLLAGVLLVAAAIHLALTPAHLGESALLGSGFLLAGLAQLALAALALARPRAWVYDAVVFLSVGLIVVYAYAVLVGLPLGGHDHGVASLWAPGSPSTSRGPWRRWPRSSPSGSRSSSSGGPRRPGPNGPDHCQR